MRYATKAAMLAAVLLAVSATPVLSGDQAASDQTTSAAVDKSEAISVSGRVARVDLEGGFYAVDGWRLIGHEAEIVAYLDQEVQVTGKRFTGVSFQMVKAIEVTSIQPASSAVPPDEGWAPPAEVRVNGTSVALNQLPAVMDGALMFPLRDVAEAAGGIATWMPDEGLVQVRMPDRTVTFTPGDAMAELNEDGVFYLTRNLITLANATTTVNGATFIPADGLALLGLQMTQPQPGVIDLTSGVTASPMESGTIREIQDGDRFRILLQGSPMSNGEPSLIWVSISDDTKITAGDQPATTADLAVGQAVEVQLAGPVLESYPAQAGAAAIRVVRGEDGAAE